MKIDDSSLNFVGVSEADSEGGSSADNYLDFSTQGGSSQPSVDVEGENGFHSTDFEDSSPRVPVCFLIDTSGSMGPGKNNAMEAINKAVNDFIATLKTERTQSMRVQLAIVAFNGKVRVMQNFADMSKVRPMEPLVAGGGTALAHAVVCALDLIQKQKQFYSKNGVRYFKPIICLITDGARPGDVNDLPRVQDEIRKLLSEGRILFFPCAIGNENNPEKQTAVVKMLEGFGAPVLKQKDLEHLSDLFVWFSLSISAISKSRPGQTLSLPCVGDSIEVCWRSTDGRK
jgi:uncharacterized protein YegL